MISFHPPAPLHYFCSSWAHLGPVETLNADICVYGATAGGIIAAIQAAQLNRSVILIEPGEHIGGMTTGGLGNTDIGNKTAIGGLSREFYRRIGRRYGVTEAWSFEPHVAEAVFKEWLREAEVSFYVRQYVARLERMDTRITALRTVSGLVVHARQFIDASYEGDLMALAGVSYVVGRESNSEYHETLNGAQVRETHQFEMPVDPYNIPRDPGSGLLPGIEATSPVIGAGDHRVQAYCFRMCLTDDPRNRMPFPQPVGYDPRLYQLLARYLAAGWRDVFHKFDRLRVRSKTDTNNHGAVSTDFIGQNYAWPEADFATRESIFQAHVRYQLGLQWFLSNDPAVPSDIREAYSQWGLCRDEFTTTGGWPPQLYVREARRMRSDYVMTEHECRGTRLAPEPVGLAAYTMDSHNCRRFVHDRSVLNEGDVQAHGFPPYPISYRAIVPKLGECENLFVPVCLSASHIAFGSIRMEPVFMILGQSAAIAADIALAESLPVQRVPYPALNAKLLAAGQVLSWTSRDPVLSDEMNAVEA